MSGSHVVRLSSILLGQLPLEEGRILLGIKILWASALFEAAVSVGALFRKSFLAWFGASLIKMKLLQSLAVHGVFITIGAGTGKCFLWLLLGYVGFLGLALGDILRTVVTFTTPPLRVPGQTSVTCPVRRLPTGASVVQNVRACLVTLLRLWPCLSSGTLFRSHPMQYFQF